LTYRKVDLVFTGLHRVDGDGGRAMPFLLFEASGDLLLDVAELMRGFPPLKPVPGQPQMGEMHLVQLCLSVPSVEGGAPSAKRGYRFFG
jgi:hypothetical protein